LGKAINHGPDKGLGFDAFSANPEQGLYALCDGANSCPDSGQAALWLCQQITHAQVPEDRPLNFEPLVHDLHEHMLTSFSNTAATLVGLHVAPWGLRLVSVGDSELTLYKRRWWGWGPWQKNCTMPKDLDANGHPRQLIASEVFDTVHQLELPAQGTWLALMMSDGPARVLPASSVQKTLQKISHQTPSSEDLNYLCETLAHEALSSGCQDDVSVAMLWIRYG
jgi:serine/threonine protein phosphatase PrpC